MEYSHYKPGNTIINNEIYTLGFGIELEGSLNKIHNNSIIGLKLNSSFFHPIISYIYYKINRGFIENGDTGIYDRFGDNSYCNNTIAGFPIGMYLFSSFNSTIKWNNITNNIIGLYIWWLWPIINKISFNNFINNLRHVKFLTYFLVMFNYKSHMNNVFNKNYWNKPLSNPKSIYGRLGFITPNNFIEIITPIPTIIYDLNPATEPNNINY
jgi:hypothetical protein